MTNLTKAIGSLIPIDDMSKIATIDVHINPAENYGFCAVKTNAGSVLTVEYDNGLKTMTEFNGTSEQREKIVRRRCGKKETQAKLGVKLGTSQQNVSRLSRKK